MNDVVQLIAAHQIHLAITAGALGLVLCVVHLVNRLKHPVSLQKNIF